MKKLENGKEKKVLECLASLVAQEVERRKKIETEF